MNLFKMKQRFWNSWRKSSIVTFEKVHIINRLFPYDFLQIRNFFINCNFSWLFVQDESVIQQFIIWRRIVTFRRVHIRNEVSIPLSSDSEFFHRLQYVLIIHCRLFPRITPTTTKFTWPRLKCPCRYLVSRLVTMATTAVRLGTSLALVRGISCCWN